MGGKKKKGGSKKSENGKSQNKKTKKQAGKTTKKSEGRSRARCNIDIFNEHAMENAYFTCHNVQDVLKSRGFPWPDAQKKKKKGKKR